MRKEINVTLKARPATPERIVQKAKVFCDICGKEIKPDAYGNKPPQCTVCDRDICRNRDAEYKRTCMEYDPHWLGDYPNKYCPICYELKFNKYDKVYKEIIERKYTDLRAMDKKVKQESLAQ